MAGNSFGTLFKVTTFGESHGKAIGVIVDGVPPNLELSEEDIQKELDRRKPGQSDVTTARKESDVVYIYSGVFNGKTTGTPVMMILFNEDQKPESYEEIKDLFRPGHADYTYFKKYGIRDYRGGGRSSGRETAARVAAGAIAKKLLKNRGINIIAYTLKAAGILCKDRDLTVIEKNSLRACDLNAAKLMEEKIKELAKEGDSVGGIVECLVTGVPPGLGEPVFDKLDAVLAHAMLSIGGVKGIEFGSGFKVADMTGGENNDWMDKNGFITNNSGGILGGISNGNDIIFRIAVKPTSSISIPQKTIDINGNEATIIVKGRHDPCICPRIVPVVEAMCAIVLEDMFKIQASIRD